MQKFITSITLGIRFNRCFRINDVLGAITDDIVNNEKSPFKDMFEQQSQSSREMILDNIVNNTYMRINSDDIILNYSFSEKDDLNSTINKFKKFYDYYKKIFEKYEIDNIKRVGIVFNHEIDNGGDFFNEISSSLTKNNILRVNNFSINFSNKIPTKEGELKSGIEDYDNVIYMIQKDGNDKILSNLDYQRYFLPSIDLSALEELKFDDFISSSVLYLNNFYYKNLPFNFDDDVK